VLLSVCALLKGVFTSFFDFIELVISVQENKPRLIVTEKSKIIGMLTVLFPFRVEGFFYKYAKIVFLI
jgi:hypothetical protein